MTAFLTAGGGIGGPTPALSLHQIGVPAKIFESVPELRPLGVGIKRHRTQARNRARS